MDMRLISFLNYIVFEIQYIVIKKSSPFYDNKKDPLNFRLREDLYKRIDKYEKTQTNYITLV